MRLITHPRTRAAVLAMACVALLGGCAGAPRENPALAEARDMYAEASANPQVVRHGGARLQEAERTLRRAERVWKEDKDLVESRHLSYVAKQQVAQARAQTEREIAAKEIIDLRRQQRQAQLQAQRERTRKAEQQAEFSALELRQAREDADRLARELEEIEARQTDRGLILTLHDVLFDVDSAEIRPGSLRNLRPLVRFMEEHPDYRVVVEGHTDNTGSSDYNERLSRNRAEAVAKHMVDLGLSSQRIRAVGRGENYPIAPNDSLAGRLQNRRVEVIVLPQDKAYEPGISGGG